MSRRERRRDDVGDLINQLTLAGQIHGGVVQGISQAVAEAGNVGALAAIMNAVVDALSPLGIAHLDMPATPEKIWRAIRAAQRRWRGDLSRSRAARRRTLTRFGATSLRSR